KPRGAQPRFDGVATSRGRHPPEPRSAHGRCNTLEAPTVAHIIPFGYTPGAPPAPGTAPATCRTPHGRPARPEKLTRPLAPGLPWASRAPSVTDAAHLRLPPGRKS